MKKYNETNKYNVDTTLMLFKINRLKKVSLKNPQMLAYKSFSQEASDELDIRIKEKSVIRDFRHTCIMNADFSPKLRRLIDKLCMSAYRLVNEQLRGSDKLKTWKFGKYYMVLNRKFSEIQGAK